MPREPIHRPGDRESQRAGSARPFPFFALACVLCVLALLGCMGSGSLVAAWPRFAAGAGALGGAALLRSGRARARPEWLVFAFALALFAAQGQALDAWDTFGGVRAGLTWVRPREVTGPGASQELPYYLLQSREGLVSRYPPMAGFVAAPIELAAALGGLEPTHSNLDSLGHLDAALLTALGVALLYGAMRKLAPPGAALAAIAVYACGTAALPLLSRALWGQTVAALGFSLAIYALFACRPGAARALLLGAGVGLAVSSRPVDALLAPFLLLPLAAEPRGPRSIALACAAAAPPVLALVLWNQVHFGNWLAGGYAGEALDGWITRPMDVLEAFVGLLCSPVRGMFVFSPVLVLGLAALLRAGGTRRVLGAGALAWIVVMSFWWCWYGGYSPGPRMLADSLPIYGVGLATAAAPSRLGRGRWLAGGLVALSLLNNLLLAYGSPSPSAVEAIWRRRGGNWDSGGYPPIAWWPRRTPAAP